MENNTTALVKSNSSLARISNQIAVTNRLLEIADPFLIPYRKGDKWGFCNRNKQIVIECVYDDIQPFNDGRASVKKNEKWGFCDKYGNIIIPIIYDNVKSFSEKLAAVEYNEIWGFIDIWGEFKIPAIYEMVYSFSEGRAWVSLPIKDPSDNCLCSLVDNYGKIIYPTKLGQNMIYEPMIGDFKDGMARIGSFNPSRWHDDDETASLFLYQYLSFDCESWWGPDNGGFEEAYDYKDGLACVKTNGWYGFIDPDFEVVIEFQYEFARPFSQGLAPVKQNGEWSYINKNEVKMFSVNFDQCYEFCDDLARVNTREEDILDPPSGTGILYYDRPRVIIREKYGFINKNGRLIIPCIYEYAENFSGSIAKVKKGNTFFYIDTNGNEYYEK